MLLGKRPRPPNLLQRTRSMTGISVDVGEVEAPAPADHQKPIGYLEEKGGPEILGQQRLVLGMVSPRNPRVRSSDDLHLRHGLLETTAHFLRTCGRCKRRLAPGRDIYMYRGDTAFCSVECREEQMKEDERKEKSSSSCVASKKDHRHHHQHQRAELAPAAHATSHSKTSSSTTGKGETVAAA
ncbi:FCS-Like Zinc finger 5 [Malania oleifera]|uniref:FCS-Like Zinc finger 5 n=1 Tax=Malania oleifera TaxID=397392 RepID=UPI0025ADC3A4|nr:FCS-Like Zinc finger 5 [Malania oleifera]